MIFLQPARAHWTALALIMAAGVAAIVLMHDSYYLLVLSLIAVWAVLGLSWNILGGYGGLISFGADLYEHYRVAGTYTALLLKGAQPADLPVQIPTKFDLMINRKTAQALGLPIPPHVLLQATEVLQ